MANFVKIYVLVILIGPGTLLSADPLTLVRESFLAMESEIHQGSYRGEFREFKDEIEQSVAEVVVDFQGLKYYIELTYQADSKKREKRVIVYDGNTLASSLFSPRISVTGANGEVWGLRSTRSSLARPLIAEFPWDPAHLHKELVHVELLLENFGDQLICSFDENDDVTIKFSSGMTPVILTFRKEFGYRVASKEVFSIGDNQLLHKYEIGWQKFGDHWFVSRILEHWVKRSESKELIISEATIGTTPDPNHFTLAALELPGGARVINRTAKVVEDILHYVPVSDDAIEKATDNILADVAKIPTYQDGNPNHRTLARMKNKFNWFLIVSVNLAVLAALLLAVWVRKRSHS